MIFPSHILLVTSIDFILEITTLRVGSNQIMELERVTSREEANLACELRHYAAYVVEYTWLSDFLAGLTIDHPPVIALVDNLAAGQQALRWGAADYLEKGDFAIPELQQYCYTTLERSLRLTITAHQQLLKLKAKEQNTEQRYIEQALQSSEAKFRAIFERSPMGIALISIERKIFQVNATFCNILGYAERDLLGMSARDITHPEDLEVTDGNISYLLNKEISYFTLEKRYLCQDGSYCWVQSAVAAVKDDQDSLQYMILLITDIQTQKETEQRIEYRLHLESIVTTVSQHLLTSEKVNLDWIIEILGKAVESDRAFINQFTEDLKYFSITHEWCNSKIFPITSDRQNVATANYSSWLNSLKGNQDIVINDSQDLPPGEEKDCHEETHSAARLEVPILSFQGKLWITLCFESITPRSWFPEDAQILRLVGEMIYSYYEKLNRQRELKASESLYLSIFNNSIDNIFLVQVHYAPEVVDSRNIQDSQDIKFIYETINPAQEQTLGMKAEEITGKTPAEVLSPEVAAWVEHQYFACVQRGEVLTYEESIIFIKDMCHYITTLVPIRDEITGQIIKIQGSARDITQVKLAEQERLRQDRYQRLLVSLTLKIRESLELSNILKMTVDELQKALQIDRIMIWQFNSDRTGKVVSEAYTNNLEKTDTENCNMEPLSQKLFKRFQRGIVTQANSLEAFALLPRYQEFLQRYQINSSLILPILLTKDRQLQPNQELWGLLSLYHCQGYRTWEPWEVEQLQQMANQLGIAICQSQLLEQERRNTRELAAYNAELAEFAYIASHDLQTPLGTISNYGYLLQSRYGQNLDATGTKFLQFMITAAQKMRVLIDDLLFYNLFNRDQPSIDPVDCNLVFQEAYRNLETEIMTAKATINCIPLPMVLGNYAQLVHLFQHLLSNSLKYRRAETSIIEIDTVLQDEKWLFIFQDNGIGLDNQYSDRIFQLFQRLHSQQEYSGTGIGLAICKKVVEFHGGRIWVESSPQQGSTFCFTLNSFFPSI